MRKDPNEGQVPGDYYSTGNQGGNIFKVTKLALESWIRLCGLSSLVWQVAELLPGCPSYVSRVLNMNESHMVHEPQFGYLCF